MSSKTLPEATHSGASTPLLRVRDVAFAYGALSGGAPTLALDSVTLDIRAGDRVGLLGASGSGKSTLLHLLAGLHRPARGALEFGAVSDRVASLVFQFPERQLFAETVRDDVAYGLRESGVSPAEVEARVVAALDEVGLPAAEFMTRAPFHLSGGEMRRVALAGALAQRRPVVLLDEPTLGLDAEGLGRLRDMLARLHTRGVACWTASHAADFVAATCDRVVVLDAGRVAYDGTPADFWSEPERAAGLGIEVPRAATLAARLHSHGVTLPPGLPDATAIAAALEPLLTSPPGTPLRGIVGDR